MTKTIVNVVVVVIRCSKCASVVEYLMLNFYEADIFPDITTITAIIQSSGFCPGPPG